jgi:hypothetical protein
LPDKNINNDLTHEIKSLKTEFRAAVSREERSDLEKAEKESKQRAAMESPVTKLIAAKTREESTDLKNEEIESKLRDAMKRIASQKTELGAAKTREEIWRKPR